MQLAKTIHLETNESLLAYAKPKPYADQLMYDAFLFSINVQVIARGGLPTESGIFELDGYYRYDREERGENLAQRLQEAQHIDISLVYEHEEESIRVTVTLFSDTTRRHKTDDMIARFLPWRQIELKGSLCSEK